MKMKCIKCGKVSAPYKLVQVIFVGQQQLVSKMDKRHIGWVRYADEKTMSIVAICPTC